MKRILITTDFSHHSRHTLEYVLNFLKDTQISTKIFLLNTYMVHLSDPHYVIALNDELKLKAKQGLEKQRHDAKVKLTNPLIRIETICQMGSLINVISQVLKSQSIDLVAIGKDGGKHVELISALLKQMKCPLLITQLETCE